MVTVDHADVGVQEETPDPEADMVRGTKLHEIEVGGYIYSVAVTADGTLALCATSDNSVKIYRLSDGQHVHTLMGHTAWVRGAWATPDGIHAISCSDDATARLYTLEDGNPVRTLVGHKEGHGINAVTITPDGARAVTAANDKELKVWLLDDASGGIERTLRGHEASVVDVCCTPDGLTVVSGSVDNTARVWRLCDGELLFTLKGHTQCLTCVAATDAYAISGAQDRALIVWSLQDGSLIRRMFKPGTGPPRSLSVTAAGDHVAAGYMDERVRVWKIPSGEHIRSINDEDHVLAVRYTPDGRHLLVGGASRTLCVWALDDDVAP